MSQYGRKIGTVRNMLMKIYHIGLEYLSNGFHADFRDRQADRETYWLTDITHIWGLFFNLETIINQSILY
jgi:hypothetical protein